MWWWIHEDYGDDVAAVIMMISVNNNGDDAFAYDDGFGYRFREEKIQFPIPLFFSFEFEFFVISTCILQSSYMCISTPGFFFIAPLPTPSALALSCKALFAPEGFRTTDFFLISKTVLNEATGVTTCVVTLFMIIPLSTHSRSLATVCLVWSWHLPSTSESVAGRAGIS